MNFNLNFITAMRYIDQNMRCILRRRQEFKEEGNEVGMNYSRRKWGQAPSRRRSRGIGRSSWGSKIFTILLNKTTSFLGQLLFKYQS